MECRFDPCNFIHHQGRLPEPAALAAFTAVCEAVAIMHAQLPPIAHRHALASHCHRACGRCIWGSQDMFARNDETDSDCTAHSQASRMDVHAADAFTHVGKIVLRCHLARIISWLCCTFRQRHQLLAVSAPCMAALMRQASQTVFDVVLQCCMQGPEGGERAAAPGRRLGAGGLRLRQLRGRRHRGELITKDFISIVSCIRSIIGRLAF